MNLPPPSSKLTPKQITARRATFEATGWGFALCMPIFYAVLGFVGGVIGAAIYNLAAKVVGGIEVEVE
jgi:hypothetical protein